MLLYAMQKIIQYNDLKQQRLFVGRRSFLFPPIVTRAKPFYLVRVCLVPASLSPLCVRMYVCRNVTSCQIARGHGAAKTNDRVGPFM